MHDCHILSYNALTIAYSLLVLLLIYSFDYFFNASSMQMLYTVVVWNKQVNLTTFCLVTKIPVTQGQV